MLKKNLAYLTVFCCFVFFAVETVSADDPLTKPKYTIDLGEGMSHPDGMTVDKNGDIILAVPQINGLGNAWLLKITKEDKVEKYFELPAHPETGRVTPLGIAFGPDGNLYIADAQCLGGDPNHKGRILRLVHDRSGKPVKCETVISNIVQPNGVAFFGNRLYFNETQFVPSIVAVKGEKKVTSGVFCYDLSELRSGRPIKAATYGKDPHIAFTFETFDKDRDGQWLVGANGLGFDKAGTMYVANFGDKQLLEVKLSRDGRKTVSSRVCASAGPIESIDGLKVCPKGYVFFADFVGNAVIVANPKNGKVVVLAKNEPNPNEEAKKNGALDRCSEVCLREGKLYISNIDILDESAPHVLSVIPFEGINFDELMK